jgi:hypothetical protein
MNLNDLAKEAESDDVTDPCVCKALVPFEKPTDLTYPFSMRRHGINRKVVLVENERGTVEYMWRSPDGHLGSIEQ